MFFEFEIEWIEKYNKILYIFFSTIFSPQLYVIQLCIVHLIKPIARDLTDRNEEGEENKNI